MKKSILTVAAAVICAVSVQAQEKTYKPVEGMSSFEVTFDPTAIFNANSNGSMFGLSSIGGLNQGIKYRMWMNENTAARGTFLLGIVNRSTAKTADDSQGNTIDLIDKRILTKEILVRIISNFSCCVIDRNNSIIRVGRND